MITMNPEDYNSIYTLAWVYYAPNLPTMLSEISVFFLPTILKIMLTVPIILQIMLTL